MDYLLLIMGIFVQFVVTERIWDTVHMDELNDCWIYLRNDNVKAGDMYVIKSDRYHGGNPDARRPAECVTSLYLADRAVTVRLVNWWCDYPYDAPFLAIYDDCHAQMNTLMARLNCTYEHYRPLVLHPTGSCVTLYFHRGLPRTGYFFTVLLIAGQDMMPLPSSVTAVVIVCILVGGVLIARGFYVTSCCRRRYRKVGVDPTSVTSNGVKLPQCCKHLNPGPSLYLQEQDEITRQCEVIMAQYRKKKGLPPLSDSQSSSLPNGHLDCVRGRTRRPSWMAPTTSDSRRLPVNNNRSFPVEELQSLQLHEQETALTEGQGDSCADDDLGHTMRSYLNAQSYVDDGDGDGDELDYLTSAEDYQTPMSDVQQWTLQSNTEQLCDITTLSSSRPAYPPDPTPSTSQPSTSHPSTSHPFNPCDNTPDTRILPDDMPVVHTTSTPVRQCLDSGDSCGGNNNSVVYRYCTDTGSTVPRTGSNTVKRFSTVTDTLYESHVTSHDI